MRGLLRSRQAYFLDVHSRVFVFLPQLCVSELLHLGIVFEES